MERPEYERLLADIAAGKIGTLIIWHANRLHRSTEEVNAFIKLARAHKVAAVLHDQGRVLQPGEGLGPQGTAR